MQTHAHAYVRTYIGEIRGAVGLLQGGADTFSAAGSTYGARVWVPRADEEAHAKVVVSPLLSFGFLEQMEKHMPGMCFFI